MISIVFVLLLPICHSLQTESPLTWFTSSCAPPSICSCQMKGNFLCKIGIENRTSQELSPCTGLSRHLTFLNVTCDRNQECDSLDVSRILHFFPDLLFLEIHGCAVDVSKYEIPRDNFSILMNSSLSRSLQDGDSFYFNLNLVIDKQIYVDLPRCNLLRLEISGAGLAILPVGFLSTCALLEQLTITGNKMYMLQELDVAVFYTFRNLRLLNLESNAIIEISPYLGKRALQNIKYFFLYQLKQWVTRHIWRNHKQKRSFDKIIKRFTTWCNPLEPLSYPTLVNILEEVGINIYFSINYSPLQILYLMNNQLSEISLSLFGFRQLIRLHMGFNKLVYSLQEPQSYALHAYRNSLRSFRANNNKILRVMKIKYLKHVSFIDVSHNAINRLIPESVPENNSVNELFLNHNRLKRIMFTIQMEQLSSLDLSFNLLTGLNGLLASSIPRITFINLKGNPIRALAPFALHSLPRLRMLHLNDTLLNEMPAETYKMYPRPAVDRVQVFIDSTKNILMKCDCMSVFNAIAMEKDQVNFSYPYIHILKNQFCRSSIDGRKWIPISLKRTYLCFFKDYCLDNCTCCQDSQPCACHYKCPHRCVCSYTSTLTDISIDCQRSNYTHFPHIESAISYLFFQYNKLTTIAPNSFSQYLSTSLLSLHLASNSLEIIGPHSFKQLTKLIFLDLSQNLIHTIDPEAFSSDVPALSFLYLTGNSLNTLQNEPFETLTSLTRLELSRNYLTCDCSGLINFLKFKSMGGASRDLFTTMESSCFDVQLGKNISLTSFPEFCNALTKRAEAKKQEMQYHLHVGFLCGGVMLIIVVLLIILSFYRYRIQSESSVIVGKLMDQYIYKSKLTAICLPFSPKETKAISSGKVE